MKTVTQTLFTILSGIVGVTSASALNVTINPGQSIQSAINQVHNAGGGTVHLNAGTYTISASIQIYSSITLEGAGPGSTIIQTPGKNFSSEIINDGTHSKGPTISNLMIQNMTLDGRGMNALNSMGIQLTPAGSTRDSYVTYSNLEIRKCGQGIGTGWQDHLSLKWNNLHDNGYAVPGANNLWYQNVYITASQNVNIPGGVCNYSTQGCGLKCGFGGTGYYINLQASNNARTGIAIQADGATFQDITCQYCTCSSNQGTDWNMDGGIIAEALNLTIDGCTTQNNLRWGIRTMGNSSGTVKNCVSTGNASGSGWSDNYGIGSNFTQSNNK